MSDIAHQVEKNMFKLRLFKWPLLDNNERLFKQKLVIQECCYTHTSVILIHGFS